MVFLMVLHLELSLVRLFSRQKFCVFLSVVLCQLVKVANQFFQCAVYLQRENILLKHFYFFFTLEVQSWFLLSLVCMPRILNMSRHNNIKI